MEKIFTMINPRLKQFMHELNFDNVAIPETKQAPPSQTTSAEFSLEDLTDCWRINYRNGIYLVDLAKALQPSKTQDEHAEHKKQIIANNSNEFYLPDYPLFHSMITALSQNKDNPQYKTKIEEARQFLKDSALKHWLMMLTRIQYNPGNKKDMVFHNYKQQDQYAIEIDSFIGPTGFITHQDTSNAEEPIRALLDTKQSMQEINQIYKWLTDVDAYISRANFEVNNTIEHVAGFYASSSWANLNCNRNPSYSSEGLGVRAQKILK